MIHNSVTIYVILKKSKGSDPSIIYIIICATQLDF